MTKDVFSLNSRCALLSFASSRTSIASFTASDSDLMVDIAAVISIMAVAFQKWLCGNSIMKVSTATSLQLYVLGGLQ